MPEMLAVHNPAGPMDSRGRKTFKHQYDTIHLNMHLKYAVKDLLRDRSSRECKITIFFVARVLSDLKQTYFSGDSMPLAGVDHHDT